jgi:small subunit ribosomal protein S6
MREYEVMLILPADAEDSVVDGVAERITGVLSQRGGEIASVEKWGRRRLAYEIAHQSEGFYVVVTFRSEPDAVLEIERVLTLADEVVRFKVVLRKAA